MTWTDERLDHFAEKVDTLIDGMNQQGTRIDSLVRSIDQMTQSSHLQSEEMNRQGLRINALIASIDQLIQAFYLEIPNLKAEINSAVEEARETREVLDAKFDRISATVERQAIVAEQQAAAAAQQAESIRNQATATTQQAESIRLLIDMLNRKQA